MRDAPAGFHRVAADDVRHVVEDLKIVLVRDERLVPVRAEISRAAATACPEEVTAGGAAGGQPTSGTSAINY